MTIDEIREHDWYYRDAQLTVELIERVDRITVALEDIANAIAIICDDGIPGVRSKRERAR